jgi:pSer/pThr/pTyr-binding forkhead associated (FHA) protein
MISSILFLILRVLFALALYAFLGLAVLTIWRELQKTSALLTIQKVFPIQLKRLDFEDSGTNEFSTPNITVGRDASCEYLVSDDTVSSHHARLSFHHHQWWAEDLNSTNGTFLNNDPVAVPTVIISGDELRVGKISIQITILNK